MKNQNGTKKSTESLFCRSRRDVMCWKIFYDEKGKRQKQKFSRLMGSNKKKKPFQYKSLDIHIEKTYLENYADKKIFKIEKVRDMVEVRVMSDLKIANTRMIDVNPKIFQIKKQNNHVKRRKITGKEKNLD